MTTHPNDTHFNCRYNYKPKRIIDNKNMLFIWTQVKEKEESMCDEEVNRVSTGIHILIVICTIISFGRFVE